MFLNKNICGQMYRKCSFTVFRKEKECLKYTVPTFKGLIIVFGRTIIQDFTWTKRTVLQGHRSVCGMVLGLQTQLSYLLFHGWVEIPGCTLQMCLKHTKK